MRVVFLEEVEGTARTGDVKNVAPGFARNYLLPRKLAAPATDHYIAIAQAKATKEARKQAKLDEEAQKLLPLVDGKSVTVEVRVGEQDKLFGSVTTRDIAELVSQATKVEIDHRQVDLKQPLREVGVHQVPVKLTRNVIATVTVNVEPIGGLKAEGHDAAAEAPSDEGPSPAETGDAEGPSPAAADEEGAAEAANESEEG